MAEVQTTDGAFYPFVVIGWAIWFAMRQCVDTVDRRIAWEFFGRLLRVVSYCGTINSALNECRHSQQCFVL